MNPLTLSIALRRRTSLETFDLAVAFVRRGFRAYFRLWVPSLGLPGVALYAWHGTHHIAHITQLRRAKGW